MQLTDFAIFFQVEGSLNQQQSIADISCFPTLKDDKLPKHLNSAITKLFLLILYSSGTKNGRNTKIAKNSHFFFIFEPT